MGQYRWGAARDVQLKALYDVRPPRRDLQFDLCPVLHGRASLPRGTDPRQNAAGKLLGDRQDAVARPQARLDGAGRRAHAVAGGRNYRVSVGIAAEQARRQEPDRFGVLEETLGCAFPGMALRIHAAMQALPGLVQLWRVVGAVEIGDVVGYIE